MAQCFSEGFYEDFLACADPTIHDKIQKQIEGNLLKFEDSKWTFDCEPFMKNEEVLVYAPLVELLNVIGQTAHDVRVKHKPDQFRQLYRPFSDRHDKLTLGDYPNDTGIKPDARAIFSHQIYRLHVFGIAVCGPIVTFVRFDRSGLLHSPNIDISTSDGADLFVRNVISLLSLPAKKFGYDTQYTFKCNPNNRSDIVFALEPSHPPRVVSSLLCHRKCCRGRATIASCLAAATTDCQSQTLDVGPTPDQLLLSQEIVHKRIWRLEDRIDEGTTLKRFKGVFGVCQVVDFRDRVHKTQVKYPSRLRHSHAASYFVPTNVSQILTTSASTHTTTATGSAAGSTDESNAPAGPASDSSAVQSEIMSSQLEQTNSATSESAGVDAPDLSIPSAELLREIRFASDLLMPKGRPLSDAQSALHVMYAMHDALLGVVAFAEAGMLHCDISAFNILLVDPEVHYAGINKEWNKSVQGSLGKLVWNSLSSQLLPKVGSAMAKSANSAEARKEYVDSLDRGPYAVLCDAECAADEEQSLEPMRWDPTGTPAFFSAQLLLGPFDGEPPVRRSFIHDLESLMWVLIWVVAHQQPEKMSGKACDFIRELSQHDLNALGNFKRLFIMNFMEAEDEISKFGNSWSKQLAPAIKKMASFFAHFLYPVKEKVEEGKPNASVDSRFASYQEEGANDELEQLMGAEHNRYMKHDRLKTFYHFLGITTESIKTLSRLKTPLT
ncbi:hypothetical protein FRC07_000003 [Ceratobasidium sp. 392]|nr:hypothetical protein FRC07_000003 [Ceratobasidium sp. 392]